MLKTYDPKSVLIIVGGAIMGGFTDGTFLSVERDDDAFAKETGADGETSRAKRNNRSGSATLTLHQTSPSNDILSAFALADELDNSGVVPFLVRDLSGRTTLFSALGWIRKVPATPYSTEIEDREWVLDLADLDFFVGGNPEVVPA